jgi:hypothetical protein
MSSLRDTGLRHEHATGALREPRGQGKGRFDLLPWVAITRLAKHYEAGANKYAERNWEKGLPLSSFVDSGIRHLTQWLAGDDGEDHLAAVLWNFAGLLWTEERIRAGRLPGELADLPDASIAAVVRTRSLAAPRGELTSEEIDKLIAAIANDDGDDGADRDSLEAPTVDELGPRRSGAV